MFRWGVLSTAKIGREQLIPAIVDAENGVLSAIASRDGTRGRALADRFGAPLSFGSYEELLASDEVDGVYIPLPTSQHVEWAIKAADAGKHVLVEKPLALKADDIAQVIAARDRNKVLICEAFMVVYHPQWIKVRELVQQGAIGRLRYVQGAFTYYLKDPDNMRNRPELGGGALADIGVYPTVSTRFVTGKEPRRIQATVELGEFGTDSFSSIRADFGDFELGFYLSTEMANRQLMVFHGDEGFIEVHGPFNAGLYDHHRVSLHNQGHTEETLFRFPGAQQYRLQVEAFARAAKGSGERVFQLEDSVKNQKVIDAIFRAGETDRWEAV